MTPDLRHLARAPYFKSGLPVSIQPYVEESGETAHDHDFMEIVVVFGGSGQNLWERGRHGLVAGDVLILRPNTWHAFTECSSLQLYNCLFGPELLHRELAPLLQDPALEYLLVSGLEELSNRGLLRLHLPLEALATVRGHLNNIRAVAPEARCAAATQLAHLSLLLIEIARYGEGLFTLSHAQPRRHPAVLQTIAWFEERPHYDWNIEELTSRLYLHRAYFARVFKRDTGVAPMQYLLRLRLERAAHLLVKTQRSIGEVALEVGLADANYFARRFKAQYGMSASVYRDKFRMAAN